MEWQCALRIPVQEPDGVFTSHLKVLASRFTKRKAQSSFVSVVNILIGLT